MKMNTILSSALVIVLLNGCATQATNINILRQPDLPANWLNANQPVAIKHNWLQEFHDPAVGVMVEQALRNNHSLLQQRLQIDIEKQQLIASGAAFWPTLDLSLNSGRNKSVTPTSYQTSHSTSLNLAYEVDVWGKLSAAEQQSNLLYLAQEAAYEQAAQQLVADVVNAWFSAISAKQLTELYKNRVKNAEQSLDIIEQGYQQGLNEALDVYLARNNLHSERANLSQQRAAQQDSVRTLERLLGTYPAGLFAIDSDIPLLLEPLPTGLPSELITRKPELLASWYQLLAKDAALAYAHKQRFPSLNLSASINSSGDSFSNVFSPSALAWSLIGSVSAPLFRGGELKANEEIALLTLKQGEQQYLDTLYAAFEVAESAINQEKALTEQYHAILAARENAVIAEQLSFEQYRSGIVTYTTVLEAQGRSYDAQSALINLKNQLIANRITLHVALGGNFSQAENTTSEQ